MTEILEVVRHLLNPQWLFDNGGIWLVVLVIFAETGLLLGFFFPGDSLLFITGMSIANKPALLWSGTEANISVVIVLIIIAGILGNMVGYWFGKKSGSLLFHRKDSLIFKQKYLLQAKGVYDKYGSTAIIMARFIPIVRTFAPIVAGIVEMKYRKFVIFNLVGCIAWVVSMVLAGYFLGLNFPTLGKHIEIIVLSIIFISVLPIIIKVAKEYRSK